jgi:hypothetical protein
VAPDAQVESEKTRRRYHLGKFTDSLVWFVWDGLQMRLASDSQAGGRNAEHSDKALKYLLDVIESHRVDLSGMKIIIFQIESFNDVEADPSRLKQVLAAYPNKSRLSGAEIVDVTTGLGPDHFLPLDGHMNALGHRRVAERLASIIR